MANSNNDSNKRIAKNTILLTIRMVFTLFVSLYATRIVLAQLGVEDYGIYNIVCGFVAMFNFLTQSMSNGIQRFYNYELSKNGVSGANTVYNSSLLIQLGLVLVFVILCETFGLWYMYNKMVISPDRFDTAVCIFHMSILSLVFSIMQVPYMASIMAHEKMDYYAFVSITDAVLRLLSVLSLSLWLYDKLFVYGLLMMILPFINLLMYGIYSKTHFSEEIKFKRKFNKDLFVPMLSFSGWNMIGRIGDILREQGVNVLLNLFFGVIVNASRGVAYQVIGGLQMLVNNVTVAIRPQIISSYAQNNIDRTMNLMYSLSKLSFLALYLISLPIIVEINFILHVWLGENVPEYTMSFVNLVIVVSLINLLNSAVSIVVHATGKMALYQTTGTLAVILILPVSYVWLRLGGSPTAPFWVGIIFAVLMQITALWVLKKLVPFSINEYNKKVLIPIFKVISITILIPFIPLFMMEEGFIRFIIILSSTILVGGFIIYFIALNTAEQNLVNSFAISIRKKFKR